MFLCSLQSIRGKTNNLNTSKIYALEGDECYGEILRREGNQECWGGGNSKWMVRERLSRATQDPTGGEWDLKWFKGRAFQVEIRPGVSGDMCLACLRDSKQGGLVAWIESGSRSCRGDQRNWQPGYAWLLGCYLFFVMEREVIGGLLIFVLIGSFWLL